MLCVFISNNYTRLLSNVEATYKPTGLANIIGNKGGVGIALNIMETSICFISSHLAARPGNMHLRMQNFFDIMKNMRFGDHKVESTAQFDYFFFMGDMNFRVDYPYEEAVEEIQAGNYDNMKRNDQFFKEKKSSQFLNSLEEGSIKFKPSYRRLRHDTGFSNKKNQTPSWCDRILYKGQPAREVKVKEYNSCEMFFCSDHRPVYGIYELSLEPPFLPTPPLHLRPINPQGVIKFRKLILDYTLTQFQAFSDFEPPLPPNMELSMSFSAKFLSSYPCTMPLKIVEKCGPWMWGEERIPLVHVALSEMRYLKNKYIMVLVNTMNENEEEILLGQASIPLEEGAMQCGTLVNFTTAVHLYGKEFGSLYGEFTYDFEDMSAKNDEVEEGDEEDEDDSGSDKEVMM